MSNNVTLPGTGVPVETLDVGSGVSRQVISVAPRDLSGVDSIGGLTETAPATDTASSGLNGRLQRIAQRLTSLITAIDPSARASAGAMQSQLSVTTGAVVTPTIPGNTTTIILALRSGAASAINYSYDGSTTPTTGATGLGFQLNPGQTVALQGTALIANLKMIAATATTAVDIGYSK